MAKKLLIALCFISSAASAEVYKCSVDGKTVFSDQPCVKGTGGAVTIKVAPVSSPPTPAENEAAATERNRIQANEKVRRDLDNRLAIRQIDEDILRNQTKLRLLSSQMEAELQALRNKKARANNNLAGAVYEQSVSSEMNAVTSSYSNKIEIVKAEIERLQREKNKLEKSLL